MRGNHAPPLAAVVWLRALTSASKSRSICRASCAAYTKIIGCNGLCVKTSYVPPLSGSNNFLPRMSIFSAKVLCWSVMPGCVQVSKVLKSPCTYRTPSPRLRLSATSASWRSKIPRDSTPNWWYSASTSLRGSNQTFLMLFLHDRLDAHTSLIRHRKALLAKLVDIQHVDSARIDVQAELGQAELPVPAEL